MLVSCTRIDLVCVGAPGGAWRELVDDYEQRLGRYATFQSHVVKGIPLERGDTQVLEQEGERIGKLLDGFEARPDPGRLIVACDRTGKQMTSEQLAERLLAATHLVVIVGGAAGLHSDVLARCQLKLAFGAATLPHQLARVLVTEQLYRAWRIARNEPYHH
jgi:23S rRNA (pseudouridine1915-N3)-methyltransferase